METLQRQLNSMFASGKGPRQPDYVRGDRNGFKRTMDDLGATFKVIRDGYLEINACASFPNGLITAHHGWPESRARLLHCIEHPEDIRDGYYSE